MKIGIVSDTHDNLDKAEAAVDFFEDRECEKVVHCGDIVAPFTVKLFDADFDFVAVRGNNDGEWNLKQIVEEIGVFYNNLAELEYQGRKIAVYHGTEEEIVDALVKSGKYDYVFRGHSHEKNLREYEGTIEINPGGIQLPNQKEVFHVAILDLDSGDIKFHRVD